MFGIGIPEIVVLFIIGSVCIGSVAVVGIIAYLLVNCTLGEQVNNRRN